MSCIEMEPCTLHLRRPRVGCALSRVLPTATDTPAHAHVLLAGAYHGTDDSCEILQVGDYQTANGAIWTWMRIFVLLIEHFLMQDASLECMRRRSAYFELALPLMIGFQLLSVPSVPDLKPRGDIHLRLRP